MLNRKECNEWKKINKNCTLNDSQSFEWISIYWIDKNASAMNEKKWTEIVHWTILNFNDVHLIYVFKTIEHKIAQCLMHDVEESNI